MKIAICLHGLASGSNSKGKRVYSDVGYLCYTREIIERYRRMGHPVDIFCHSWSVDVKDQIIKWYQPTKYCFQEQINFINSQECRDNMEQIRSNFCKSLSQDLKKAGLKPVSVDQDGVEWRVCQYCRKSKKDKGGEYRNDPLRMICDSCFYFVKLYYRNLYSLYHSYYYCNQLKKDQERISGEKYQMVITSRYDLWISSNSCTDLTSLTDWENGNVGLTYFLQYEKKAKKNIIDHLFISSSERMDDFCQMLLRIPQYTPELIKRKIWNQHLNHEVIKIFFEELAIKNGKLGYQSQLVELGDKFPAGALATLKKGTIREFLTDRCPEILNQADQLGWKL